MKTLNQYSLVFLMIALAIGGCKKTEEVLPGTDLELNSESSSGGGPVIAACLSCWVSVGDRNNDIYEFYDPLDATWSVANRKWSFKPSTGSSYSAADIAAWDSPLDLKLREVAIWATASNPTGKVVAAVSGTGSKALVAIGEYSTGKKKWTSSTAIITGADYPHAAEILPNGNIAVAATHSGVGGWVKLFSSSQVGTANSSTVAATFMLDWAHGVLYDPGISKLWVCGGPTGANFITALNITGTAAVPGLSEAAGYRTATPSGGFHDLAPYHGDTNSLLLTTTTGVYKYNKTTKVFTALPGAIQVANVKGMSNMPSTSEIFTTLGWTNTVKFYSSAGTFLYDRVSSPSTRSSWYKCRTFNTAYQ